MCIIKKIISLCLSGLMAGTSVAQKLPAEIKVSGTAGITYEHYDLMLQPKGGNFYYPRRPWNVLRITLKPVVEIGKIKIPFNLSFLPKIPNFSSNFISNVPTNFPSVPAQLGGFLPPGVKQTFGQFLSNPLNNFGANPKYKWAELQLGTQYIRFSDLSTGDIGVFGYGFNLNPGKFRIRFFNGTSQQAINYLTSQPAYPGAYKRKLLMAQIGLEREGKYFAGFNILKGTDKTNSISGTLPPTINPQENVIVSFLTKVNTENGWVIQTEIGQSYFTGNKSIATLNPDVKNFEPFIKTNISSFKDNAVQLSVTKQKNNYEVGVSGKWLGAGYSTMGYPFIQNDRLEYSFNTRITGWKNKLTFNANIGQRFGNWSKTAGPLRNSQLIANGNLYARFNDHFNISANYNNFGFFAPSNLPQGGIKNVGADLSITPMYTYTTEKMSHIITASYNLSKYVETTFPAGIPLTTNNNTQTILIMYVPTWLNKPFTTDISVLDFSNKGQTNIHIQTISCSFNYNFSRKNILVKSQLSYNVTSTKPFSAGKNLITTLGIDCLIKKNLTLKTSFTTSLYKYGNDFSPEYANPSYYESLFRTGLHYTFKQRTIKLKK